MSLTSLTPLRPRHVAKSGSSGHRTSRIAPSFLSFNNPLNVRTICVRIYKLIARKTASFLLILYVRLSANNLGQQCVRARLDYSDEREAAMKNKLFVIFATAVFLCTILLFTGCASAPYLDSSDTKNRSSSGALPHVPAELLRKIETDMVKISAGTLPAGYRTSRAHRTLRKDPEVKIRTFLLSKHEVTQDEWTSVMGYNPSEDQGSRDLPVTNISWDEARQFIGRLNEAKGTEVFRLPTSMEWEYACRAGAKGSVPMQAKESTLSQYAWWEKNSGGRMHPVGQLKPNAWGLYDMLGNVSEWLQDPYDPETSQTVRFHAGAYFDDPNLLGQDCRPGAGMSQDGKDSYTGLRIAKSAEQGGKAAVFGRGKKEKK